MCEDKGGRGRREWGEGGRKREREREEEGRAMNIHVHKGQHMHINDIVYHYKNIDTNSQLQYMLYLSGRGSE